VTKDGKDVSLTTGEYSVLKVLVQHPRQPLSRDKLMELARGREYEVFDRSIDVQISRLRKIVEDDPSHPKHIQTVWGFGYVFVPDDSTTSDPSAVTLFARAFLLIALLIVTACWHRSRSTASTSASPDRGSWHSRRSARST